MNSQLYDELKTIHEKLSKKYPNIRFNLGINRYEDMFDAIILSMEPKNLILRKFIGPANAVLAIIYDYVDEEPVTFDFDQLWRNADKEAKAYNDYIRLHLNEFKQLLQQLEEDEEE